MILVLDKKNNKRKIFLILIITLIFTISNLQPSEAVAASYYSKITKTFVLKSGDWVDCTLNVRSDVKITLKTEVLNTKGADWDNENPINIFYTDNSGEEHNFDLVPVKKGAKKTLSANVFKSSDTAITVANYTYKTIKIRISFKTKKGEKLIKLKKFKKQESVV